MEILMCSRNWLKAFIGVLIMGVLGQALAIVILPRTTNPATAIALVTLGFVGAWIVPLVIGWLSAGWLLAGGLRAGRTLSVTLVIALVYGSVASALGARVITTPPTSLFLGVALTGILAVSTGLITIAVVRFRHRES